MMTKRTPSVAHLQQALREKTREVDVLHRISASISNQLDLEAILKHIVEVVVEVTKSDACLLYLLSDSQDELILRASKNPHPKLIGRITIGLGEGITGWVAQERMRVVIPSNANDDPRFKFFHNLPEDRYQAFVSVPIMAKKEVVGVINVQHKRPKRYQPDEIALLSTIANQVGGAIENARLYDQMQRKALQVETLSQVSETVASNRLIKDVLELLVTMTAQMMNSKICSIMLLEEASGELRIAATQSLSEQYRRKPNLKVGQSIIGRAVKERRPIVLLALERLTPVDGAGIVLPVNPFHAEWDAPVLDVAERSSRAQVIQGGQIRDEVVMGAVTWLDEVGRRYPELAREISSIRIDAEGMLTLHLVHAAGEVLLARDTPVDKMGWVDEVIRDLQEKGVEFTRLDLRFPDQIVVRRASTNL